MQPQSIGSEFSRSTTVSINNGSIITDTIVTYRFTETNDQKRLRLLQQKAQAQTAIAAAVKTETDNTSLLATIQAQIDDLD